MQYTLFPFGNSAAATSGVGNGLCAKHRHSPYRSPVVRAISVTTASQRKRQRGAHGVDVGFTE
jgi:hypothetical protein